MQARAAVLVSSPPVMTKAGVAGSSGMSGSFGAGCVVPSRETYGRLFWFTAKKK